MSVAVDVPGAPREFADYDVGDWVGLERPGGSTIDLVRVIAIGVKVDADGSRTVDVTFSTFPQALQEQFAYLIAKFGAQFLYSLGTTPVISLSASSGAVPTVITPGLGGLKLVAIG